MHINCKNCKKYTGNTFQRKLIIISQNKFKRKWKCAICLTERTFIDKIEDKYDLEGESEVYIEIFVDWCYKRKMKTYCVKCKKDTENIDPKMFRTKNGTLLISQNVLFVELKSQDL